MIKAVSTLLAVLLSVTTFAQRNPLAWPFAKTSIWNMPIHKNAAYVPIGMTTPSGMYPDEDIVVFTPNAPLTDLFLNTAGWDRTRNRCLAEGALMFRAPIPADFEYSPANWSGLTPNSGVAILMPDGRTIKQTQPFSRCVPGSYATSQYNAADQDIYGAGIVGAHGGSGMSAIGGTLRVGELQPGSVIRHALKMNLYANKWLSYDKKAKGFRWPALRADSYASREYKGTIPQLRMGALLAIPASVTLSAMGLETEPARIIARALQEYGAYVVDDTAWNIFAFVTESGPAGRFTTDFRTTWGYDFSTTAFTSTAWGRDLARILARLAVVDNNTATTIGGGTTTDFVNRLAPMAPDFAAPTARQSAVEPEADATDLLVYPNPIDRGILTVTWGQTTGYSTVSVVSLQGKVLVRQPNLAGSSATLDVTSLPAGGYILSVEQPNKSQQKRIVIQQQ